MWDNIDVNFDVNLFERVNWEEGACTHPSFVMFSKMILVGSDAYASLPNQRAEDEAIFVCTYRRAAPPRLPDYEHRRRQIATIMFEAHKYFSVFAPLLSTYMLYGSDVPVRISKLLFAKGRQSTTVVRMIHNTLTTSLCLSSNIPHSWQDSCAGIVLVRRESDSSSVRYECR